MKLRQLGVCKHWGSHHFRSSEVNLVDVDGLGDLRQPGFDVMGLRKDGVGSPSDECRMLQIALVNIFNRSLSPF